MHICGNFGPEKSCSNCKHYGLVGVCSGVCCKHNYEDTMSHYVCDDFEKRKTNTNNK